MGPDELRVGDAERRAAIELLAEHFEAGRLDSHEYEDRRGRAADAVTRHDLDVLFNDLPALAPDGRALPRPAALPFRTSRQPRRVRDLILGLVPFVALLIFLRTGSWVWFLLIPITALVVRALFTEE
ncbi:DUF1707 domain-containing protein [Intrasporangium sp. DVR]|uniref:DUF1707 SHOCT-like domain-containing protein n=1 Tax=Intrasporangium sp. DVR TaxID=3127867 RepID=UPI00313A5F8A